MNKISTIIFDIGDVLIFTIPDKQYQDLSKYTNLTIKDVKKYIEKNLKYIYDFEIGLLSDIEFKTFIEKTLQIELELEEFKLIWNSLLSKENKEIISLVLSLQKKYSIILASNTNPIHWEYIKKNFTLLSPLYDTAILSYMIKERKPNHSFFEHLPLTKDLKNTLFIDDNINNIISANHYGLTTIQYTNNLELIIKLKDMKIIR